MASAPNLTQRLRQQLAGGMPATVYADQTLRQSNVEIWAAGRLADGQYYPLGDLTLTSRVGPDLLAAELPRAEPAGPGRTFALGLDPATRAVTLSPVVLEPETTDLPLPTTAAPTILIPAAGVEHFDVPPIEAVRVLGMTYRDRVWRQYSLPNAGEPAPRATKRDARPLPKAHYKTDARAGSRAVVKAPSFWDLVYVVLQPPIILNQLENLAVPHKLFHFQPAGIEFLMEHDSALLADEMGTGKTVMTTMALRLLFRQGRARRALILAPVSVLREWRRHLEEWAPELLVTFVRGARQERKLDWQMPAHVYVTTYDTLRNDLEQGNLKPGQGRNFDIVVLDEAQAIKNLNSGRSKAVRRLKARQRWALTGTPIENKVDDVAALFAFLRPGHINSFELYPSAVKAKIAPYFLRRRKADVLPDLPAKIKQDFWLELDKHQRAAYNAVLSGAQDELKSLGRNVTRMHIFRNLVKLKQICNFAPGESSSPKLDLLKEQIEDIVESDAKVIVFSQFIPEGVDKLEQALKAYGTARLTGGQSEQVRNQEIERFRKSSRVPILLASVKAGGVGLNLTEASYVVHFDHWWNPAVMWQAEARVHRPGQTRGVNIYSYWMANTIEVKIHTTLKNKGLLFDNVIEALAEDEIEELISTEEWLEMFGITDPSSAPAVQRSEPLAHLRIEEIRDRLYQLTPARFEHLVKRLLQCFGYPNVRVTGRSGDGGIDVLSTRNTSAGVRRAIAQCKRYRNTVGVEAARGLLGVMSADPSIEKAYLVTTSDFSSDCVRFCEGQQNIELISGLRMATFVKQFGLEG